MALLQILQYPDSLLRRRGREVTDVNAQAIKQIISDMLETLKNTPHCAALAATQLNIPEAPNIVLINPLEPEDPVSCLINPKIIQQHGSDLAEEGCMSIAPELLRAPVQRASEITVQALTPTGSPLEFTASGFLARCIQHECDHLAGILYLDHLSKLRRLLLEKKLLKHRR